MARLDHLLARNLGTSRGKVRELLAAGRLEDPAGGRIGDGRREVAAAELPLVVCLDGERVELHDRVDLLLHKPVGVVTALRDERHRVAAELVRDAPLANELRPVGRLDLETSGLLLWTSDGPWLQRLTHPKRGYPRTYQAALARPFAPPPPDLELEDGHRPTLRELRWLAPEELHPALARPDGTHGYASITVVGGAYHEVRRIFAALGSHVLALARVGFGGLELPCDLPAGGWRRIDPASV